VGPTTGARQPVDAAAALAAYAACDARARVESEAYLSAFAYGQDFLDHLRATGSTRDFNGPCWAPFVWLDLDGPDLGRALHGARRLAGTALERYPELGDDDLLVSFSGSKGFHFGVPTSLWGPGPSVRFNAVARRFAEGLASSAGVVIDGGVFDKLRLLRAPNTRHPRTGLHKRRLSLDELLYLSLDGILRLAQSPEPFDLPGPAATSDRAAKDWAEAEAATLRAAEDAARRRSARADGTPRLNRLTMDFIREGAPEGERHRRLFSAAANLAEFGCPPALAHALLTEAGLDSGLPPSDVRRQVECGLEHVNNPNGGKPNG
jgi:hypothetical protein